MFCQKLGIAGTNRGSSLELNDECIYCFKTGWLRKLDFVNNFAVLQYQSGKLEIVALSNDEDPIDLARRRNAYLIGITASKSRADFILSEECERTRYKYENR
jgi:hypothetical protein